MSRLRGVIGSRSGLELGSDLRQIVLRVALDEEPAGTLERITRITPRRPECPTEVDQCSAEIDPYPQRVQFVDGHGEFTDCLLRVARQQSPRDRRARACER